MSARGGASGGVSIVAWTLATLVLVLSVAYVVLYLSVLPYPFAPYGFPGGVMVFTIASSVFGALIVSRQPRNAVGWTLIASSLALALTSDAQLYAVRGTFVATGSLPMIWLAAWLGSWLWAPGVILLTTFLPLLIPNGRLESRGARVLALACVLALVVPAGATAAFTFAGTGAVPVGSDGQVTGAYSLNNFTTFALLYAAVPVVALIALIRMGIRLRKSHGDERQQLKWFAYSLGIVLIGLMLSALGNAATGGDALLRAADAPLVSRITSACFVATLTAIPLGAGVSVLKYRLYDIDLVLNRTLAYGALAAVITGLYVAIVIGIGSLIGNRGTSNVFLSIVATALVAVAFQPARSRLQRVANRLVYGKRATPYEVLSELSEQMAGAFGGDDLLPRVARLLAQATGAQRSAVWLRVGNQLHQTASWPDSPSEETLAVMDDAIATGDGDATVVPVRHQGELLGALTLGSRRESLNPTEQKLVDDLAAQAGLVLRNVGLTEDLRARLEDLRASRQRLVRAQDQERRRLERNLHDGAQQNLVALKVKLGLLKAVAKKDPERVETMAQELADDADLALETLRDLARGIYPPLLADKGLAAALQTQAAKAALPVDVREDGLSRYPQEVEGAVYFCCLEALQNIAKYAHATRATISLTQRDGTFAFSVEDDGAGFDTNTVSRGSGLQNMEDRLDALGGSLEVTSNPGAGTRITGSLPVG